MEIRDVILRRIESIRKETNDFTKSEKLKVFRNSKLY